MKYLKNKISSRKFSKTSIRVVIFTGLRKDYPVLDFKFLTKAGRLMFKKILLGTTKIPTETEYDAAVAIYEAR